MLRTPESDEILEELGWREAVEEAFDLVAAAFAKLVREFETIDSFTLLEWIDLVVDAYAQLGHDRVTVEKGVMAGLFIGIATVGRGYLTPERRKQCKDLAKRVLTELAVEAFERGEV